jgi:hypothetical protein
LSNAGFIHWPSDLEKDRVRCVHCDLEVAEWEQHDEPMQVHRENKPDCRYVTYIDGKPKDDNSNIIGLGAESNSNPSSRPVRQRRPVQEIFIVPEVLRKRSQPKKRKPSTSATSSSNVVNVQEDDALDSDTDIKPTADQDLNVSVSSTAQASRSKRRRVTSARSVDTSPQQIEEPLPFLPSSAHDSMKTLGDISRQLERVTQSLRLQVSSMEKRPSNFVFGGLATTPVLDMANMKQQLADYETTCASLTLSIAQKDAEITRLNSTNSYLQTRIEGLVKENSVLRRMSGISSSSAANRPASPL